MSSEAARIGELEKTIETLVAYLRRLPINPETYRHANEAEAVLRKRACDIALLTVEMAGLKVTVRTQDVAGMSESFLRQHKAALYDSLVAGIVVPLVAA